MLPQRVLQNTLFPIGHLTKSEVRRIANEAGFKRVNEKKEVGVQTCNYSNISPLLTISSSNTLLLAVPVHTGLMIHTYYTMSHVYNYYRGY